MPFAVHGAYCPACGKESIVYDELNTHQLSCTDIDCPRMMAAQEILSEPQKTDHIVSLQADGYSVKHPLIERLDNKLLDCFLANYVAEFGEQWVFDPVDKSGGLRLGTPYRMWDEFGVSDTPEGRDYDYGVLWPSDDDGNAIPFDEEKR